MGALRLTSITDCRSRNCEESATTLQNKVTSEVAKFFRRYITLVSDRKQEPSEPQTIRFEIFSWQRQKINFRHHIRVGGSKASIKKTPFSIGTAFTFIPRTWVRSCIYARICRQVEVCVHFSRPLSSDYGHSDFEPFYTRVRKTYGKANSGEWVSGPEIPDQSVIKLSREIIFNSITVGASYLACTRGTDR